MSATITLISSKKTVLDNFLTKYFEKDMMVDSSTSEWSYILDDPLALINLIAILIETPEFSNNITIWASIDQNLFIKIKNENYEDFIKYIVARFSS